MASQEITAGTIVAAAGQSLNSLAYISRGQVHATFPGGSIDLKKGDFVGLIDIAFDSHFLTYQAVEDTTLLIFPLKSAAEIGELVWGNADIGRALFNSMNVQTTAILSQYLKSKDDCEQIYQLIGDWYGTYTEICNKNKIVARTLSQFDSYTPLTLDNDIAQWLGDYYESFDNLPKELSQSISENPGFLCGFLNHASTDLHGVLSVMSSINDYYVDKLSILMQDNSVDLFDYYSGLLFRLIPQSDDFTKIRKQIEEMVKYIKAHPGIDPDLLYERVSGYSEKVEGLVSTKSVNSPDAVSDTVPAADLNNATDIIIEYSGVDEVTGNHFRTLIMKYKKLADKNSSEDAVKAIRNELTATFYQVYVGAARQSFKDDVIPTIIKMFLNFGFVDSELAGEQNTAYLFNIAKDYFGDPDLGVYTAQEWLQAIYTSAKSPCRNEFDTDYLEHLHELKVAGKISAGDETALAHNPEGRLKYEVENMFPLVNKLTFGRITTFCPVFSEHNVLKPLQSCLVSPDTVTECLKRIRAVDYSAFYRETVYSNEPAGIKQEFIAVEILPDIILLPNIGSRGVMWQEIEGKKRTTPARFMLSAFHIEDLQLTLTHLVGEYRWEMCKRVQGSRWNDVTDRSLTSEYFDYVQFYKKNNELSQEAKEKIKQSLIKSKNSFKEMFVRDYIIWVMFEGTGSPRLNKIARAIFCTYCPFPYELRSKVIANPLYKEVLEHYEIKTAQKLHRFDNLIQKLTVSGVTVPQEIIDHRNFLAGK